MKAQFLKTNEVIPYYNNPRNNNNAIAPVAESIKRFGFTKPILVDAQNVIIAGHTRYFASVKLGLEKVPVIVSDMTEEQAKQFRIVDNKTFEKSYYDTTELVKELKELKVPDDMQCFFIEDINALLNFSFGSITSSMNTYSDGDVDEPYDDSHNGENESDGYFEPETEYDGQGDAEQFDGTVETNEPAAESEPEPVKPIDFFKPYVKDGKRYIKVMCPYCNNIETLELN